MYKRRKNEGEVNSATTPASTSSPVKKEIKISWDDTKVNASYKSLSKKKGDHADQAAINNQLNTLAFLTSNVLYKLITRLDIIEAPISVEISLDPNSPEKENLFGADYTPDSATLKIAVSATKDKDETKAEVKQFLLEQFSLFLDEYMLLPENEYVSVEDLEFILEQ